MTDREYFIDYTKPEEAARATINMHKDTLVSFRGVSPKADELEWEIRVYEFMLQDPVTRLQQYQNARFDKSHGFPVPIPKRKAIEKLGWDIK